MDAVGLRIEFRVAQWQENIKAARAGKLMMWNTGWVAALPDGQYFLDLLYGPNAGQSNTPRFSLPAFDRLYEQQQSLPDGPERDALIAQAMRLSVAQMPYVPSYHPLALYLTQRRVHGFRPHPFARDFWRWMDVD
jgi:ABC-type transport system substrate-binding protein